MVAPSDDESKIDPEPDVPDPKTEDPDVLMVSDEEPDADTPDDEPYPLVLDPETDVSPSPEETPANIEAPDGPGNPPAPPDPERGRSGAFVFRSPVAQPAVTGLANIPTMRTTPNRTMALRRPLRSPVRGNEVNCATTTSFFIE